MKWYRYDELPEKIKKKIRTYYLNQKHGRERLILVYQFCLRIPLWITHLRGNNLYDNEAKVELFILEMSEQNNNESL